MGISDVSFLPSLLFKCSSTLNNGYVNYARLCICKYVCPYWKCSACCFDIERNHVFYD